MGSRSTASPSISRTTRSSSTPTRRRSPFPSVDPRSRRSRLKRAQSLFRRRTADIRIDAEPAGAGVKLIVTVKRRPILRSVDYQGIKRLSKTDIQDKLSTQRIHIREGEPMSLGELQRVKALIEELYAEKGYRFAQAKYTITDSGPHEKKVVFTVDEGNRVRISDITFEGNTGFNDLHLRWAMRNTKKSGPITG